MDKSDLALRMEARVELLKRKCREKGEVVFDDRKYNSGFELFVEQVFAWSFDEFISGEYIRDTVKNLVENDWTMDISARDHFKSTRLYAEIMYDIFTAVKDIECHYFSYQQGMSGYHLTKVKEMIGRNPFFYNCVDLTRMSRSTLRYNNGKANYSATPQGLLSFKRGIHAERIYIDDPLKDPENKLAPTVIYKINNIIKMEMFAMVKKGGICRVVGTPQTNSDFFFDEDLQRRFKTTIKPAIRNEKRREVIFPEWKSYEDLVEIRNILGEKSFNQEYMAKPAYEEESYIGRKELMNVVDEDLREVKYYDGEYDVVGGFDIGKKAHPSHLTVFERREVEGEDGESVYVYRQLLSKWFDGVDYSEQIEYLKMAVEDYNISKLRYDNTRGEFELFRETGLLPSVMEPVVFSYKMNNAMASSMSKVINEGRVKFLNEDRQIEQLLQVNNELKAIESVMGHGDSFWSNALALKEEAKKEYKVRFF